VTRNAQTEPPGLLARAGHLALWIGLYFAGAYLSAAILLVRQVSPLAIVGSFLTGVGLYLLDRVKVRDSFLDPADLVGQPERHGFLHGRRSRVRALAWGTLAAGTVALARIHPLNLLLPPVLIGGVIIYASIRRERPRPKDVLLLKNLLPGGAISVLAVALAWESPARHTPPEASHAAGVLLGLVLAVTADAMLCDLDDIAVDRRFGTQTLAARYGRRTTWTAAMSIHAAACATLVLAGHASGALEVAATWAAADLAVTGALWAIDPPSVRDLIDGRLPIVALIAWSVA
jgi:4-hydroxybenzoate polyprenyltransferase